MKTPTKGIYATLTILMMALLSSGALAAYDDSYSGDTNWLGLSTSAYCIIMIIGAFIYLLMIGYIY